MPAELREHLRYPEDLFRVQTDVYSKYQLEPEQFFQRQGAWSVAQAPSINPREPASSAAPAPNTNEAGRRRRRSRRRRRRAASRRTTRCSANAAGTGEDFVILRPFVPFSSDDRRTELQAYMTASSDPDNYGQLTAYVADRPADGPRTVSNNIDSEPAIATTITQQTGGGNQVRFGDLQIVPVAGGLLWVRPMYAVVDPGQRRHVRVRVTEYRFVIASYNDNAAIGDSLGEALARVVRRLRDAISATASGAGDGSTPEEPDARSPSPARPRRSSSAPTSCCATPKTRSTTANLGEYQAKVDEAAALIDEALGALQPTTTVPSGEPSTDTTTPASTAPAAGG